MARYMPDGWTLPEVNDLNRPFFTTGKLMLQHCVACDTVQHPPEDICRSCQSDNLDYVESKGTGEVYSYVLPHHPPNELLNTRIPYNIVLVQLDDHPHVRIVGNLVDTEPDDVKIGIRVNATWEEIADPNGGPAILLPQWVQAK